VNSGLGQPTGIALDRNGNVLVVDFRSGLINRIAADGTTVTPWSDPADASAKLNGAAGIAVDAAGNIYVADHQNYRVAKFDPSGELVAQFGSRGTGTGQLDAPDGVALDADGLIYVSEDHNARVQVFDQSGSSLRLITDVAGSAFGDPTGLAVAGGQLYVADFALNRIDIFSAQDELVSSFGSPGSDDSQFQGLSLMATDASGHIYATDYENGRIQEFDPSGAHIATYVLPDGNRFRLPYGVVVGPDGDLYVSEFQAGRVDRLRRHA
jgi:DNA-binding beta-propeller fold protein YncE